MQVSLPLAKLASLGVAVGAADAISVNVEANTTILPVAAANDPDPQTRQEIALATGPLRRLAAETFDTSADMPDTGKLLGLLINALPAEDDPQPVALDGLLRRIVASVGPGRLNAETVAETAQILKHGQQFAQPAGAGLLPQNLSAAFCRRSMRSTGPPSAEAEGSAPDKWSFDSGGDVVPRLGMQGPWASPGGSEAGAARCCPVAQPAHPS